MNFIQYVKQTWKARPIGGTPFTPDRFNHIEDGIKSNNDMIRELNNNNITNNICTNLLNPTLKTSSQKGITCTNNNDGTYTFTGTATAEIAFVYNTVKLKYGKYKLLDAIGYQRTSDNAWVKTLSDGDIFEVDANKPILQIHMHFSQGTTVNNLNKKPMITTNLNATHNDFVSYTGNTGRLNADVALLNNNISNTDNKIKTYYISTPTELTFKKGTYWVFINKTQYSQSSIWTVDSSANPPVALANPSGEKMTKVLNDDNTMTIKWNNASYAAVSLLKVVVN
nr:MAG TPA: hypothetical protein [Caudoviricetes sp.]